MPKMVHPGFPAACMALRWGMVTNYISLWTVFCNSLTTMNQSLIPILYPASKVLMLYYVSWSPLHTMSGGHRWCAETVQRTATPKASSAWRLPAVWQRRRRQKTNRLLQTKMTNLCQWIISPLSPRQRRWSSTSLASLFKHSTCRWHKAAASRPACQLVSISWVQLRLGDGVPSTAS